MHAASVNPEPGSNSRNYSILTSAKRIKSIPSLIALSLPFLELYSLSELRDVLSHLHALYSSLTVQFSKTIAIAFRDSLIIISHSLRLVNRFFESFFGFFQLFSFALTLIATARLLYHVLPLLSIPFLRFFGVLYKCPKEGSIFRVLSKYCTKQGTPRAGA